MNSRFDFIWKKLFLKYIAVNFIQCLQRKKNNQLDYFKNVGNQIKQFKFSVILYTKI